MKTSSACITMNAGRTRVSMAAASIRQIIPAGDITRVPLTRPGVVGVLARDGRAIPVYEIASLLGGGAEKELEGMNQVVIIEHEGMLAGILVESAESARTAGPSAAPLVDAGALLSAAGILGDEAGGEQAARAAEGES